VFYIFTTSVTDRTLGRNFNIYLLAKIPLPGTKPWRAFHPKILIFAGTFKLQRVLHTGVK
jgi:hypothetical protein